MREKAVKNLPASVDFSTALPKRTQAESGGDPAGEGRQRKTATVRDHPVSRTCYDGLYGLKRFLLQNALPLRMNYRLAGPEDRQSILKPLHDYLRGYDPPSASGLFGQPQRKGTAPPMKCSASPAGAATWTPIRDEAVDIHARMRELQAGQQQRETSIYP